jgi:hypothetical protein
MTGRHLVAPPRKVALGRHPIAIFSQLVSALRRLEHAVVATSRSEITLRPDDKRREMPWWYSA